MSKKPQKKNSGKLKVIHLPKNKDVVKKSEINNLIETVHKDLMDIDELLSKNMDSED
ncbi:MAG TPA: hypothetical protein PKC30_08035 [Saprospiraceae bacterium]|nr:hypothetical protein [Saprospiraceae bacterium]